MITALPPIIHDPEALWAARYEVRRAYEAIKRLRRVDPTIANVLDDLDELCCELTSELESIEPEMNLRGIVVIPIGKEPLQ